MRPGQGAPWRAWLAWLLTALLGLGLYLAAWPLIYRLVILPEARPDRPGLLAEEHAGIAPTGPPRRTYRSQDARLRLAEPQTSLIAHGLWRAAAPGFYNLELHCDDYGSLALDGRTLIDIEPTTAAQSSGQAKVFLEAGDHLLSLVLHNGPGSGWLEVRAGPAGSQLTPLGPEQIVSLDLGNLGTWLGLVSLAQKAGLALLLAALLALAWLALRQGQAQTPAQPAGHASALWRSGLGLALLAGALAWPSGQEHWLRGLPWDNGPQALVVAVLLPWLLILGRGYLGRQASLGLLLGLLALKLALAAGAPAGGLSLKAYENPARLAAGAWEPTYASRWQGPLSGVLHGPLWQGADLPLAWQARKPISDHGRLGQPIILEVEGFARLPAGARLALVAGGASSGRLEARDEQGRAWDLPLATSLEQLRGADPAAWPQGNLQVRAVIHYDHRPWQDWSLIPLLLTADGQAHPLSESGVLWRERAGLEASPVRLALANILARLFDAGLLSFLAGWLCWAGRAAWGRGILNPGALAGAGLGLALPWLLTGLGLGWNAALIAGLTAPLALLGWLAARRPALTEAWRPNLAGLLLWVIGPGLLGWFILSWWGQAGQASLLSYGDDFGVYQLYAHRIAVQGDWWLRYMQFLHFQPLYPYILALLHLFFGQAMLAQNLLDVWAALAAAALLPVLAARLGAGPAWGLAAALVYLAAELGPDFTWHIGRGLQEHTAMLFLMLTARAVSHGQGRGSQAWAAGLLALSTYLLRQDYALALAGLGLWGAWRRGGAGPGWGGLMGGAGQAWPWLAGYGLALALGPLLVAGRNKVVGGLWVLTNPGHLDHLLGATNWLRSLATILCVAPPPGYHCYAASVLLPGALAGMAALVWRGRPLAGYPLALGLTIAGLLAPYLVISPYAYEPRQSIHLLPLAALSLVIALHGVWAGRRKA